MPLTPTSGLLSLLRRPKRQGSPWRKNLEPCLGKSVFESQKVAIKYFSIAAIFFGLQVIVGLLLISKYIWPDPLIGCLPFNTARAIHTNLLVVWMIFGFMGGTDCIVPEESGTELFTSPSLSPDYGGEDKGEGV